MYTLECNESQNYLIYTYHYQLRYVKIVEDDLQGFLYIYFFFSYKEIPGDFRKV